MTLVPSGGKCTFFDDQWLRVAGRRRLDECVVAYGLPHVGRGDHDPALKDMAALQRARVGRLPAERRAAFSATSA